MCIGKSFNFQCLSNPIAIVLADSSSSRLTNVRANSGACAGPSCTTKIPPASSTSWRCTSSSSNEMTITSSAKSEPLHTAEPRRSDCSRATNTKRILSAAAETHSALMIRSVEEISAGTC